MAKGVKGTDGSGGEETLFGLDCNGFVESKAKHWLDWGIGLDHIKGGGFACACVGTDLDVFVGAFD